MTDWRRVFANPATWGLPTRSDAGAAAEPRPSMSVPKKKIRQPRAILDRKGLVVALEELAGEDLPQKERRARLLALFKTALADGRAEIRRRFEEDGVSGATTVAEQSYLMDQIIVTLYDHVTRHVHPLGVGTTGSHLALMAVGGYGRGDLCPYSDIDLLFLLPYKATARAEQVVEAMLYVLWDLGLKVGHATRSIDECLRLAQQDVTIRTALLESRYLWGDRALSETFKHRYRAEVVDGSGTAYVEAKLGERDDRHDRLGDSRYVLEPNVKEDKGGLRDLHTLMWMARYLYGVKDMRELVDHGVLSTDAARRFVKARTFLWTVRCHLHYMSGRAEDRLTFDLQKTIAGRMGYVDRTSAAGVERFMKHYFLIAKDVGDLTRIFCAVLEEGHRRKPRLRLPLRRRRQIDGFPIDGERLTVADPQVFESDPVAILRLFRAAQTSGADIHPQTLKWVTETLKLVPGIRQDPEANALFLDILTDAQHDPEITLRRLNEAGVFGRFIPDFGRVVAQMQYDMYHVYTTDEHTIRAVGILSRIERGLAAETFESATQVMRGIASRRALYVAVLMHDIAKGRGGDHSEIGAKLALRLCPRLGLTEEETETVSWLVAEHLTMSRTAFKRDIDDPQTIRRFADRVQSRERLKLLFVLTCADIRAVGPNVWNNWKGSLLSELYWRTDDALSGGLSAEARDVRVNRAKRKLREALAAWPEALVEAHLARGYPSYWLTFDTESHVRHARLVAEAETHDRPLTMELVPRPHSDVVEVTIYTADHPGLFARITGAIALLGCTIVDAKITTLTTGMALDTFTVLDPRGELPVSIDKQARLRESLETTLTGRLDLGRSLDGKTPALPGRTRVFTVPPRVIVDNEASKTHTVLEVNGRDRPGFLHDVTRTLTDLGLQIASAHISTYGERVVDVFYVKDAFGMKVDHPGKITQVRQALMAVLDGKDPQAAPAKKVG